MIIREKDIFVEEKDIHNICKESIYFDLEHYVYKKPVCVGVFGCCYYDEKNNALKVTQYMIENKMDSIKVLEMAKDYFLRMKHLEKKYIVTFSGNNDFTVINYLFNKFSIEMNIEEIFTSIDLQKEYERTVKKNIGLKALEKEFKIHRNQNELISGSNLAKTFNKIIKDKDYIKRMPFIKKDKILLYNEQDVVSLFLIHIRWDKTINELIKEDKGI